MKLRLKSQRKDTGSEASRIVIIPASAFRKGVHDPVVPERKQVIITRNAETNQSREIQQPDVEGETHVENSSPQSGNAPTHGPNGAADLEDVEPWDEPVSGPALLDEVESVFRRYLVLPEGAAVALALWVAHTYAFGVWFLSPILGITSPEKRCGKSKLLMILEALVCRPLLAGSMTSASVFRSIDKFRPTLLADEAETWLDQNNELRGIFNSGHTRTTAYVMRCVGDNHDPRRFSSWAPKIIAKIGPLPETIDDRAIPIKMRRKKPGELVEPIRMAKLHDELSVLRRKLTRWGIDNAEALNRTEPTLLTELNDRAQDNWGPPLAIADAAGGDWPAKGREAAIMLSGGDAGEDPSTGVQLLADIKVAFDERQTERLSTEDLIRSLCQMDDRPWVEIKDGGKITPRVLAGLLKPFDVVPRKIRIRDQSVRGYERGAFQDAFERYLANDVTEATNVPETFRVIKC